MGVYGAASEMPRLHVWRSVERDTRPSVAAIKLSVAVPLQMFAGAMHAPEQTSPLAFTTHYICQLSRGATSVCRPSASVRACAGPGPYCPAACMVREQGPSAAA